MSRKPKTATIWFRFKFADTAAGRMQIQRAADKLFRLACVSERRTYTEEEVVRMVATALEKAALVPGGQQAQAPAPSKSAGRTVRPTGKARRFTSAEIMEARNRRASITITKTNTDKLPRVLIEWPTGEVSMGVLKQNLKEPAE